MPFPSYMTTSGKMAVISRDDFMVYNDCCEILISYNKYLYKYLYIYMYKKLHFCVSNTSLNVLNVT